MNKEKDAMRIIYSELIFILLPIIIAALIIIYKQNYKNLLICSDWSYISIILFGQTIIKLFFGVNKNDNHKSIPLLILILVLILVFGLIPSILVLVFLELSITNILWVIILQWCFLIISIIVFINVGYIGQILGDNKKISKEDISG